MKIVIVSQTPVTEVEPEPEPELHLSFKVDNGKLYCYNLDNDGRRFHTLFELDKEGITVFRGIRSFSQPCNKALKSMIDPDTTGLRIRDWINATG